MSNAHDFPNKDEKKTAAQALREFADMIESMDPNGVPRARRRSYPRWAWRCAIARQATTASTPCWTSARLR